MFLALHTKNTSSMNRRECSDALFEATTPNDDILWLNMHRQIRSPFDGKKRLAVCT